MRPLSILPIALLLAAPSWAAPGTMIRDEDMRASGSAGAAVVGRAAQGATVEILARQGGWTQISSSGRTGWVRILAVKSAAPATGAGDVLGLVEAATGKREPGKVVAVAGVRGLDEEELKSARFSASELVKLERYASDRADAQSFARSAGLQAVNVPYLPNPKKAQQENINVDPFGLGGS